MRIPVHLAALLLLGLAAAALAASDESASARDLFERTLLQLMHQRRMFLDGFANGTAAMERKLPTDKKAKPPLAAAAASAEGRGKRKKLKQMNRTLMAVVMAYTLKFLFLIPSFLGTLILLKFTTALAGFFYTLFAAVLGLDGHREH